MERNRLRQVFQATSPSRWKRFRWSMVAIAMLVSGMILIFVLGVLEDRFPPLPHLSEQLKTFEKNPSLKKPVRFPSRYSQNQGFKSFLQHKVRLEKIDSLSLPPSSAIRAVFYSPWQNQSFRNLQVYGDKCNLIFPEWFFIDSIHQQLDCRIDLPALAYMKKMHLKIVPVLSNFHSSTEPDQEGFFDGNLVKTLFRNPQKTTSLIQQIKDTLSKYDLQGINTDFEELSDRNSGHLPEFQEALGTALHPLGMMVTMDIIAGNSDYDPVQLSKRNDYLVLMAYDQHFSESEPGPVAAQHWVEAALDYTAANIPSNKIILGVPAFGYDWPRDGNATSLTYYEALALARSYHRPIQFDNDSYNLHFTYTDLETDEESGRTDSVSHEVWFTDAATLYNIIRFSDDYVTAGTALWNLGSEDPRIWTYYGRDLSDVALSRHPFAYKELESSYPNMDDVTFQGEGELLEINNMPVKGRIRLSVDSEENIISEQEYQQFPSVFTIRKFGEDTATHNRKIVLTFDDGPDPIWTPRILDVLEKEKVPASFFVVGMQAEKNIPLVRRIFNDGFEIGNHTFTHRNIAEMSSERSSLEIRLTRLLIECITGHSTVLFRPPYNADSEPRSYQELVPIERSRAENYYTVGESIDPNDWENNGNLSPDSIFNRIVRQQKEKSGSIILLHDAGGETRAATLAALPRIIHYFRSQGFVFSSIAGLSGKKESDLMPALPQTKVSELVSLSYVPASLFYWLSHFLNFVLYAGIILSISRMILVAVLAYRQNKKSTTNHSEPGLPLDPPGVSIIVPAYNESVNAVSTVTSLLQQDYPLFEILFVDDGSTDLCGKLVEEAFRENERVVVFTKTNGGKASALNYGIQHSRYDYLVCIDADTKLKSDAIKQLMIPFFRVDEKNESKPLGAVAGNVKVRNEINLLTRWQSIEYITAQNFDRRAFDLLNAITVVPGAIGAFHKPALSEAGGFTTDTLAEDCDLTMRLLKAGYRITSSGDAIAFTEVPENLRSFLKQRFRWTFGVLQSFWKHHRICFNPAFQNFGMIALPNILLFQILLPLLAPLADLILFLSLVQGFFHLVDVDSTLILIAYLAFTLTDLAGACLAFSFEKENPVKLIWLIPQRLFYRQLMYYIFLKSIIRAVKGEVQGWGHIKRTGHVKHFQPV